MLRRFRIKSIMCFKPTKQEEIMKSPRLLIALTVLNLGLLVFLLAQVEVRFLGFRFLGPAEVHAAGSVLRGLALEITDDEGRTRARRQDLPGIRLAGWP